MPDRRFQLLKGRVVQDGIHLSVEQAVDGGDGAVQVLSELLSQRYTRPGDTTNTGGCCASIDRICTAEVSVRRTRSERGRAGRSTYSVSFTVRAG